MFHGVEECQRLKTQTTLCGTSSGKIRKAESNTLQCVRYLSANNLQMQPVRFSLAFARGIGVVLG